MNMLEGDKGLYLVVDTWKPEVNANVAEQEPVVNGNVDDEPYRFEVEDERQKYINGYCPRIAQYARYYNGQKERRQN